jgi:hypothetical protein
MIVVLVLILASTVLAQDCSVNSDCDGVCSDEVCYAENYCGEYEGDCWVTFNDQSALSKGGVMHLATLAVEDYEAGEILTHLGPFLDKLEEILRLFLSR